MISVLIKRRDRMRCELSHLILSDACILILHSSAFSSHRMSNLTENATTTEVSQLVFDLSTSTNGNRIKFAILLVLQCLSLPAYLHVFYQFRQKRQLRESLFHHVILLLLIVSFLFLTIALPFTQAYLYTSRAYPGNNTFCSLWNWIHYSLNMVNLFLMAFASIERNWLIFHPLLTRSNRGRVLLHYAPLLFCLAYPPAFYFGGIFLHQCPPFYDYTQLLCVWPCYFNSIRWSIIDVYFNNLTISFCIPTFCSIIYIRVFMQKRVMQQQAFQWRRDKKMILQLWAVSSLYMAVWIPLQLLSVINTYVDPNFLLQAQIDYLFLLPYMIHFFYPFIVMLTHPKEMLNFKLNRMMTSAQPMQS